MVRNVIVSLLVILEHAVALAVALVVVRTWAVRI